MSLQITDIITKDVRFPTSSSLAGSDAMNKSPDYSAAYVILKTTDASLSGHGLTFTIGRGNDVVCKAISDMKHLVVGKSLDSITSDMGAFWKYLASSDSQLRWIGPEKGVIHLALAAVVNAIWDLWAKSVNKPVWQLVADMSPQEIVKLIDFTYITDCITPNEALDILEKAEIGKEGRRNELIASGYPCYTTSAGWLGYSIDKVNVLAKEAVQQGFTHIKFKVGENIDDDIARLKTVREAVGDQITLMIDANQVWEVDQAIDWVKKLEFAKPWFIEEPTSPDDIEGHRKIRENVNIKVATGEMCHNRVMFKQFIMRDALDIVQIDSCRLGGVNEVLAVMLMAAKYGKIVCPHAGGVGLCEYVQHLSMIDYLCISGSKEGRIIEYVDHLHEHFINPCVVADGCYLPPEAPGYSIEMKPSSIEEYTYREEA